MQSPPSCGLTPPVHRLGVTVTASLSVSSSVTTSLSSSPSLSLQSGECAPLYRKPLTWAPATPNASPALRHCLPQNLSCGGADPPFSLLYAYIQSLQARLSVHPPPPLRSPRPRDMPWQSSTVATPTLDRDRERCRQSSRQTACPSSTGMGA